VPGVVHQGKASHILAVLSANICPVGGLIGTALPVPIVGTLIGACLGAFIVSPLGDSWAGRPLFPSGEVGWGAAAGRFWGTVAKLAIGGIIVVILALAAFF
jgi:uncharacterized protein